MTLYSVNNFKVAVGETRLLSVDILNPISTLRIVNNKVLSALEKQVRPLGYVAQTIYDVRDNLDECDDASSYMLHSKRLLDFLTHRSINFTSVGESNRLDHISEIKDALIAASDAHVAVTKCREAFELIPSDYGSCDTTFDQIEDYVSDVINAVEPFKRSLLELNHGPMLLAGLMTRLMDWKAFSDFGIDFSGKSWLDKTLHGALWKDYMVNNNAWQPYHSAILSVMEQYRTRKTGGYGDSTTVWNAYRFLARAHRYHFSRIIVPKVLEHSNLPRELIETIMDLICKFQQVLQTKTLLEVGCVCEGNENNYLSCRCENTSASTDGISEKPLECGNCGHCNRNLGPWDETVETV